MRLFVLTFCSICLVGAAVCGEDFSSLVRIEVIPPAIELNDGRGGAQLLVTGYFRDDEVRDLTRQANYDLLEFANVQDGYVTPTSNGNGKIVVSVGSFQATVDVTVKNIEQPTPISFRHETLAILTKQGCNSGSCHGKPNGRGALELSLNAFDPQADARNLVRGGFGRFTHVIEPDESLMLKKPSLVVTHGGGKRLRKNDLPYRILRQWIAEGCQTDLESSPRVERVVVSPSEQRVIQLPVGEQQVSVRAHFADGQSRDVTRIASYSVSNNKVAEVAAHGLVTGLDRGQTAVVVRYLDEVVSVNMTFVKQIDGFVWNDPAENNDIDRLVHQKLRQLQYLPSPDASDAVFIRRLSLDVRGLLPSVDETKNFLADDDPDKRSKLINRYLDSAEYARFWGLRMADLLRINKQNLAPERAQQYSDWVFSCIAENMPYDEFVTQLLTATGKTSEVPAANFFRTTSDTKMVTETVAQLFMGSRVLCAQCHNHPYESWTQDNYYQIGAAFHEVERKTDDPKKLGLEMVIGLEPGRPWANARTGDVQKPWPIDVERTKDEDKRIAFAKWLTAPGNPFFARAEANRIWAHLFGLGLVNPVDDFRSSNPASNVELLDAMAIEFEKSGFDRKQIMRQILNSKTYQRSSAKNEFNATDEILFSHARVRLLTAEQLQDAIQRVCQLGNEETPDKIKYITQQPYPELTTFLKAFGQPERTTACACERRDEASLDQALQLMNSDLIRQQVSQAANRLKQLTDEELLAEIYLAAFSRHPTQTESQAANEYIAAAQDRTQAIEDLIWVVLNTNEFIFQH